MNADIVISRLRILTAFAVVLLSGLAFLGVPSAAADELPTPATTSEGSEPADGTVATPTPEPSDVPTSGGATPEVEESVAPTEAAGPSQPVEESDDPQPAEGSEATEAAGAAESAAPTEVQEAAPVEGAPISSQAISEPVLDPRASIGDLNCVDLMLPVTLDNTRSTGAVAFSVVAQEGDEAYTYDETIRLAAGATKVVGVPVTGDISVYVEVGAWDPSNEDLSTWLVYNSVHFPCMGAGPRVSISNVDCGTLTVPVTLDNSRSLTETSFSVVANGFDWVTYTDSHWDEDFAVPAGESKVVPVAVGEDSNVRVLISLTDDDDEGNWLAQKGFDVDCVARGGGFTTATIGDLDCTTRTLPVSIDNSAVESATGVGVYAEWGDDDYFYDEFDVATGATRVMRVPVPRSIHDPVDVFVENFDAQTTLDDFTLASRLVPNTCPTTAARPTVAVGGVKLGVELAQTGGFDFRVPLLGVALIGTGGLLALAGRRPRR